MDHSPPPVAAVSPSQGRPGPEDVWREPAARLLARLHSTKTGLDAAAARSRLAEYGLNDTTKDKRRPLVLQFLARFANPLIIILLIASAMSAASGDVPSFVVITVIVLLSISLDFVQEMRAQSAVEALRRSVAVQATVRRDGHAVSLPIDQLVPGDIAELIAGDLVPADCRLLESRDLYVNQALLTGEPYPAEKLASDAASGTESPTGASNAVYAGTSVISGTAVILVCRTGAQTALGHLAKSLAEKPPATAFTVGIRHFGMLIMRFTIFMVLFVLVVNLSFHRPLLESVMFAVALAVGLTPELLPMIVTVTLARSALQLSKRRVIVKRLSAIHDLGAMDVLCTDKTGTLTEATIKLVRTIDGHGAACERAYAAACINSRFESGMKSPLDAAIVAARPFDTEGWRKIDEVPFDFERRRVSVLVEHAGKRQLIVKGSAEDILRLSGQYEGTDGTIQPLDAATRKSFEATLDGLGAQGYRALGIASRLVGADHATAVVGDETALVFSGFAVFLDPPKASAGATIQAMAKAGVAVKVLTGDNEQVSRHVFQEIGVPVTGVLTGAALEQMSDEALIGQLPRVNLFCRINPQQKHRVLLALKRLGHVVGFMGDGINDAPALHAADVGISVDGAADVARAAADLILLDHDLSVVRDAVTAGRETVLNVSKYVLMGASSNFGNMFSMAGAALILPFLPMLPIQILLNNLIYNVSEVAIPFDNVDPEAVVGPVQWDMTLVQRFMLVFGPISSVFDFLTFYVMLHLFGAGQAVFQTAWFVESMITQVLVVFCIRTRRLMFRSRPGRFLAGMTLGAVALAVVLPLPPIGRWFGFVPPPPLFFAYLMAATLAYLVLVEAAKIPFYWMIARAKRARPLATPATEPHRTSTSGWLRAAVLGANDGVLSTASLVLGVAAAHGSHGSVLVAGLSGLVAGAMSMASGEYVSVHSQADTEGAELAQERNELRADIVGERKELAAIYVGRGLDRELANQVALQLMAHDALGAHARDELGLSDALRARPVQAALASAASFAAGAIVPLMVSVFIPAAALMPAVAGTSLLFLAVLGALAARVGGAKLAPAAIRVLFWGALAMGVTAGIGALFGTIV